MTSGSDSRPRAFVFGNAALDEVFLVRDLPAAGESVLGVAGHAGLGGKGANQAIALSRTGIATRLLTAAGSDWHGDALRKALAREALETTILPRPDLSTDRSVIFAQENGENMIVTTNACAASISAAECLPALQAARPGDAVLLQGNLGLEVTAAICRDCARRGLYLVLNPSPFDAGFGALVALADALFVNTSEAHCLTGSAGPEAVRALLDLGAGQVVLTLGAEGALLGDGGEVIHVPATPARIVDATGAGDCFEGVAVGSALRRGTRIDAAALRHASRAAAQSIARVGAASAFPSAETLAALMAE